MADRLDAHPAACLFPMMEEEALDALALDIRENGQRVPIVVHKGLILDGRNRYEACAIAGVAPKTVQWDGAGGTPTRFVVSMNLHRRQLTPSQLAMVAQEIVPLLRREIEERRREKLRASAAEQPRDPLGRMASGDPGVVNEFPHPATDRHVARNEAAASVGVNPRYVQDAAKVAKEAPDLAQEVREGKRSLPNAKKALQERKGDTGAKPQPDPGARVPERPARNYLTHISRLVAEAGQLVANVAEVRDLDGAPERITSGLDEVVEAVSEARKRLVRLQDAERKVGA